jgi:hypothetical protein
VEMQQQLLWWVWGPLQPHHMKCMVSGWPGGVGAPLLHAGCVWCGVLCVCPSRRLTHTTGDQRLIDTMLQPAPLSEAQQQHCAGVWQRQQARVSSSSSRRAQKRGQDSRSRPSAIVGSCCMAFLM